MAYKAFIIGVNEYLNNQHYRNLEAVMNDIDSIYQILLNSLCNYDIKVVKSKNATYKNLSRELEHFFNCDNDDILFMYWSGHGTGSGFVTYDTDPTRQNNTSIDMKLLGNMIESTASKAVVAVFDSCYSGAIARSATNTRLNIEGDGKVIMASSDYYEESYESKTFGHGNFTHFFLEGLRGGAATVKGVITANGLHDYICEHIGTMTDSKKQTPVFKGIMADRIILNMIAPKESSSFHINTMQDSENVYTQRNKIESNYNFDSLYQKAIPVTYTDLQKSAYMKDSYESIKNGLVAFIDGIKHRMSGFDYTCDEISSKKMVIKFFINGNLKTGITIWLDNMFHQKIETIYLQYGVNSWQNTSSFNEMISCEQNDDKLYLKMAMDFRRSEKPMNVVEIVNVICEYNIIPMIQ